MSVCPACRAPLPGPAARCPACGAAFTAAGVETISSPEAAAPARSAPESFGRYRLLNQLGSGGMGVVWKALDPTLHRVVALKQLRAEYVGGEAALARFLREARLAAALRHPGIVGVYDVGAIDGLPFIAMEFVEGRTLEAYLAETAEAKRAGGSAAFARLREEVGLLADIAEAVAYAHGKGVVHRDLKPANVLLDVDGRPHIVDFGLAKEVRADAHVLTQSGQALGTPAYMAPEQAAGEAAAIGPHSDVWALGVILYELLTGACPFEGTTVHDLMSAVVAAEPLAPRRRCPAAPAELERVCLRALDKDPARRYPAAGDVAAELRRWLRGEPVEAPATSTTMRARRWLVRRRRIAVPASAVVLLVLAVVGWARFERSRAARNAAAMLDDVARLVREMEDTSMKTAMPPEALAALSQQPMAILDRLIETDPTCGPAFALRGEARALLADEDGAQADFDRGCALAPGASLVWYLRGIHALERYARERGFPPQRMDQRKIEFVSLPEETADQKARLASGLSDLERMVAADPAGADDRSRLGRALAIFYGSGGERAAESLPLVAGLADPRARRIEALAQYRLGRYADSVRAFDQALAAWPRDIESFFCRALARFGQATFAPAEGTDPADGYRAAIADLDRAIAIGPARISMLNCRGVIRYQLARVEGAHGHDPRSDYRLALADFDVALKASPALVDALNSRGLTYVYLGVAEGERAQDPRALYARGIADLDEVVRRQPGMALAYNHRGTALQRMGDAEAERGLDPDESYRRALADYEESLRIDPALSEGFVSRGGLHTTLGDREAAHGRDPCPHYRQAVADEGEALRLEPGNLPALGNRGVARLRLGQREAAMGTDARATLRRAIADFEECVRKDPRDAHDHDQRGAALSILAQEEGRQGGDPRPFLRAAIAAHDLALKIDPGLLDAHDHRGIAYKNLGLAESTRGGNPRELYQAAIADFAETLRVNPARISALYNRGNLQRRLGETESARGGDFDPSFSAAVADFDRVIELQPGFAQGRLGRGLVFWEWARALDRRGRDPDSTLARAEDDFRAAAAGHEIQGLYQLGALLAGTGRYQEGIESLEACAKAAPGLAADCRAAIEQAGKDRAAAFEKWRTLLEAATSATDIEKAVARLERVLVQYPNSEREVRLGESGVRADLARGHVELARGDASVRPAQALDHLEAAVRYGFAEQDRLRSDPAFASLHGDERFEKLLSEKR